MNESDKTVLKRYHQQLTDIIVDEDLLGDLYQASVFEKGMNEIIRAQATSTGKTQKLLELLPKRGPTALSKFIKVIEDGYPWLATVLMSAQASAEQQRKESRNSNPTNYNKGSSSSALAFDQTLLIDRDIKQLVAAFVHKQFGQSKRISEKDKKSVEHFLSDQIQGERNRYQRLLSSSSEPSGISRVDTPDDVFTGTEVSDKLYSIHLKLEPFIFRDRLDFEQNHDYLSGDDDGHPDYRHQHRRHNKHDSHKPKLLPEDMDFDLIDKEIDIVLGQIESLNGRINDCMSYFDSHDHQHPLSSLVGRVIRQCRSLEDESMQDRHQITSLLNERDMQSDAIQRLETERMEHRKQIQATFLDMAAIRQEKSDLKLKIKELEHALTAFKQGQHQQPTSSLRIGIVSKAAKTTPRGNMASVSSSMTGSISQSVATGGGGQARNSQRPGNNYLAYARRGMQGSNRYGMAVTKKKMARSDTNLSSTAKF